MGENIVTIQLTVPALEKLFENEPEFKLSMQKAAMVEFSKRAISGLMDESMRAQIAHEVAEQVGEVKVGALAIRQIILQPEILEHVRSEARAAVARELVVVRAEIAKAAADAARLFVPTVSSQFKSDLRELVNAEVRKRMLAAMEAK